MGSMNEQGDEVHSLNKKEIILMNEQEKVERINAVLSPGAQQAMANLQATTGLKKVDVANRALLIYEFIDSELRAGKQLIIRDDKGPDQLVKIF